MDDLLPGPEDEIKTDLQQFSLRAKSLFTWSPSTTTQQQNNSTKHKPVQISETLFLFFILKHKETSTLRLVYYLKENLIVFCTSSFEHHIQCIVLKNDVIPDSRLNFRSPSYPPPPFI